MRNLVLGLVLLLALGDSCSNGIVGVQDYGSVTGRVLDAMTNKPVPNAIVSVGSIYTVSADAHGAFTMPRIPIGSQSVTARAPGFTTTTADVRIHKDKTATVGYLRVVPLAKPESVSTLPPPAPEPTETPAAVATWVPASPSPSDSPTLMPTSAPSPPASPATAPVSSQSPS
ncbi:MAG: carboxypeptidase-like regulatory domain-containing protein [Candidatus Baltobacteraceae bacterium]